MKRSFPILALALLVAGTLFAADKPAASDRENLLSELARTEARFLTSVEGLSEAQWNFKAAPDRWSIAECAEHIAASEPMIRGMIAEAIKKELTAEMAPSANKDEALMKGLVDRSKKFKAPEPLVPTNRYGSTADALASFKKERAETVALASGDTDLRTHGDNHFLAGPLDGQGWFLFLSGHSERHTLQIEEVKADPNFPKE
ncbi:MAG TPA: DinB family protein [Thermoanaerobaculia bacterium]|nr:DinB family protein [Thermoanaerobaculia bacterium]